jgi:hypothetical protein
MTEENKDATVGAKITEEKRRKLRIVAAQRDTTVSDMLRKFIDEVIDQEEPVPVPEN